MLIGRGWGDGDAGCAGRGHASRHEQPRQIGAVRLAAVVRAALSVNNIGYSWRPEERSDQRRIVLDSLQVGLDAAL